MTAVGFGGLWLCKQLREQDGLSERQFMHTNGGAAVWLFSGYFVVGLLVLMPLSVMLQKRAGVRIPGPTVPRWIGWSLITIALMLASLILLIILGVALTTLFHT
jgi:hypothetical protein